MPRLADTKLINFPARNRAFRIPWLLANPVSTHANYAENTKVLRVIFGTTIP